MLANGGIDADGYKAEVNRIDRKYYVRVADHFVASLSFEDPNIWFYPFQDSRYEELGGTNYKK